MGAAIAGRLAGLGHEVAVWNRTAARARGLGLPVAATPVELVSKSETVITLLADGHAVSAVYREMLEGQAAGKLFGFAGGEAADVERARPLLSQLCRRLEHIGPAGAGASMKLAVNLPLLVYYEALSEALSLLKDSSMEPEKIMSIIGDTSGAPAMLKNRGPQIAAVLAGEAPPPPSVDVDTIRKDLREMLEEARSLGFSLPVAAAALERYDAASRAGLGAKDCTVLPGFTPSKRR
jgi:3-hydroxyisobutyrate dehydrogenase